MIETKPYLIDLTSRGDARGCLTVAEVGDVVPFVIKRVYWLHGTKHGVSRGYHSHRVLRQVLVATSGNCVIEVENEQGKQTFELARPDVGLYIGPGVWRVMKDFTEDCVLMVLASEVYDEEDYIRDYDEFRSKK